MTAFTIAFRSGATGGSAGITENDADAVTNWTGGSLDTDSEVQGTGCIGAKVSNATNVFSYAGTSRDFIGGANDGDHIYTWLNCLTPNLDTIANGGLRIRIGDSATVYREFYVGGDGTVSDDPYAGGWKCFVVDPTLAADSSRIFDTGTPDMNICDTFGGVIATVAMISGNFNNGLIDAIRIGSGLRVINGTTPDPAATFADFISEDEGTKNNKYGVCRNVGGVNLFQGKLFFGDGTTTTVFTDTDAVCVWENANVATDFYELYINTDATVTFGAISSGVTSGGCFFDSEDTGSAYSITVVEGGTVEAILNAYASTFNEFRIASFNPSTTLQDCTFSNGGQMTLNGATMESCSVISSTVGADTGALLVDNQTEWQGGGTNIVQNTFFGNNATNANSGAIEISATGTFDFDNLTFSGNSFDVINSSGGAVTINVINGGDTPTVRNLTTSTTTVNNAVQINITGLSEGAAVKTIADETVGTITSGDVLDESLADSTGKVSFSLNYEGAFEPSGLDVIVRARQQGLPNAAIADDGGVFTDETTNANSATTDDVNLLPASPVANDAYYFGHAEEFPRIKIDVTDGNGTGSTITWEYWNGSSWTALSGVTDGTSNFENVGENIVSWTVPGNWTATTVNSQGPYKYVRARLSTLGSANQTRARKVQLDVTRYIPFVQNRTITGSGLDVVASWNEDTIAKFTPTD